MSKEKRRVPKLRFPGFTEDWEQRKLNDLVTIRRGLTYKPSDIAENGIRVLRSSNIDEDQFITSNDDVFVNIEAVNIPFAKNGDILITSANGSNRLVGKHTIISDIADNSAVHGGFMLLAESNNSLFTDALLSSNWYKRFINTYVAGGNGAIGNLSKSDLESQTVMIPSEHEQAKIGQWYDNINQLITLHQRKLDNLKLKKKALLQKLFPKNGERYPELRFPGFTDAWEQRKFSDITYLSGIKNKENKPYESYSISNEFGFIPQDEQFENGGTMKTADKSMYYIVSQNSFAYNPARINVGSIGYYNKPDNVIVSSLYEVFKTTDIVSDKFLWHWFKSNQFNRLIEKYQEGGVRLYFYYDKLCKGTIDLPTINEQNKISNLLDDLDMYITLHQRKLDHLKLQKKALLQQMFV